jgi:hypothetical protein
MSGYATFFELSAQPMPDCFNGSLRKTICEEISQDTGDTGATRLAICGNQYDDGVPD